MAILSEMEIGDWIELRRERENPHDKSAIALYWQQEKIGFLPSVTNQMLAQLLDANALPLLACITNLNREVKPWESVEIAVYFFQEENKLNPHADYLLHLKTPRYHTKTKLKHTVSFENFFETQNRVIELETIENKDAKNYFKENYADKLIKIEGKEYAKVADDGIYTYLYNVKPIRMVTASNGEPYILFGCYQEDFILNEPDEGIEEIEWNK